MTTVWLGPGRRRHSGANAASSLVRSRCSVWCLQWQPWLAACYWVGGLESWSSSSDAGRWCMMGLVSTGSVEFRGAIGTRAGARGSPLIDMPHAFLVCFSRSALRPTLLTSTWFLLAFPWVGSASACWVSYSERCARPWPWRAIATTTCVTFLLGGVSLMLPRSFSSSLTLHHASPSA